MKKIPAHIPADWWAPCTSWGEDDAGSEEGSGGGMEKKWNKVEHFEGSGKRYAL